MEVFGFDISLSFVLVTTALLLFYKWSTNTYDTFTKLHIPGPRPFPLFGNLIPLIRKNIREDQMDLYKTYGKIVGIYSCKEPILIPYDIDVIKHILIKDFTVFRNRFAPGANPFPINQMLFSMIDDQWTRTRNLLSTTFTDSKLRKMVSQINKTGRTLTSNLEKSGQTGEMFDCLQYSKSFTMDTIAGTLLSLDINSMKENNSTFTMLATRLLRSSLFGIGLVIVFICPSAAPVLHRMGITIFPRDISDFYEALVRKTINYREENPDDTHNDFLQLMLNSEIDESEVKKQPVLQSQEANGVKPTYGKKIRMTHSEVIYTSMVFLFAGFDTVANPISMAMFSLATNPDCQKKAYDEIMRVLPDGRDPTFDDVKDMKYIKMCMEETLRMFPGTVRLMRTTKHDIDINGLVIPKGMSIFIPVYTLQNDPDVWDQPEKFDPERFSPEAKQARDPYYWMPFGSGPRACIAQRLGMLEIRMAIIHLIRAYRFLPSEKTKVPIPMQKFRQEPPKGNWLRVEPRK